MFTEALIRVNGNSGKVTEPTSDFRFRERGMINNLKTGANVPQIQTHLGFMVLQQWFRYVGEEGGEWKNIEVDFNLGHDEK